MLEEPQSYYSVSIHPSRINIYYQTTGSRRYAPPAFERPEQFRQNATNGKISPGAKRKISRAIDYITFLSKPKKLPYTVHGKNFTFKLNFITLTLSSPQVHSDQEIKSELLHAFFVELARKWKVPTYIWRAEKQKNGNLHFHIITGKFIPWNELRNVWNRIQQKLGYVTRYRENRLNWHRAGFRYDPAAPPSWSREKQLKAYKNGIRTDWDNPNSTDVHSIRHIGNIRAYFVKYMTKSQPGAGTAGRLWGCSINLSHLSGGRTDVDSRLAKELEVIFKHKTCWSLQTQYYTIYCIDHSVIKELGCDAILKCFFEYIRQKFPEQYPPTLF